MLSINTHLRTGGSASAPAKHKSKFQHQY